VNQRNDSVFSRTRLKRIKNENLAVVVAKIRWRVRTRVDAKPPRAIRPLFIVSEARADKARLNPSTQLG